MKKRLFAGRLEFWRSTRARLVTALLIFVAVAAGAFRFFPLEILHASETFRLWRSGLRSIESPAGDHGVTWQSPECEDSPQLGADPFAKTSGCACVVLVHGMGDQVWTWRKLLTQREWTRSIGRGVRLVAWDLPGHGDSPEPPPGLDGDLQLRAQLIAQRLLGATQALGCGRDTVWVGNSFGGAIATWVALKRPDQVRGLVLLAPGGMRAQRLATLAKDTLATPTADSLREFRQRAYAKPQPDYPSWIWRAAAERAKRSPVSRILKVQQDEDDLTVPIHSLAVPTWVLWGKQDRILPLENGQGFREIPKASLREWREIEGCGHLPQKECSEDVFRVVLSAASA